MEKFILETEKLHFRYATTIPVRKKMVEENDFCRTRIKDTCGEIVAETTLSSLPGVHQMNVDEIQKITTRFFNQAQLQLAHIDFSKRYFNMVVKKSFNEPLSNEALFHIECLLYFIVKKTYPELVKLQGPVRQNALFSPLIQTEYLASFDCLKWKISPSTDVENMANSLAKLRSLNPHQLQRFDGNRQFELQDFITFMNSLKKRLPELECMLDYVEEPFKDPIDLAWAKKLTPFTFALDESFVSYFESGHVEKIPPGCPLVLKPSLLGISTTIYLVRKLADSRIIISSTFEHPDLKEVLHFLAAYKPWEYHGLSLGNTLV